MRRFFPILTIGTLVTLPAAGQADLDAGLMDMARPFLIEEDRDATKDELADALDCVMDELTRLPDETKREMLAQDDFEDALDIAVMADEAMEQDLEACF